MENPLSISSFLNMNPAVRVWLLLAPGSPCAFCFYFTIFFGIFRGSIINDLKSSPHFFPLRLLGRLFGSSGAYRRLESWKSAGRHAAFFDRLSKNQKGNWVGFLATVDWLLFLTFSLKWRERHNTASSRYLDNYTDICWNL